MMCTFFYNKKTRIYNVFEDGSITPQKELYTEGNPESICFAPNGRWGMLGSHTTSYPFTQKTIILKLDKNRKISVLGSVHNEYGPLVSISPDSRYGVYGNYLKSLRFFKNNTFQEIPSTFTCVGGINAPFSVYNRNFLAISTRTEVSEYTLLPDGRTSSTGFSIDLKPIIPNYDIKISPDGKTCVLVGCGDYHSMATLRLHKEGGFHLAQKIHPYYTSPCQVGFTPDSNYAIVSFSSGPANDEIGMISYIINGDSTLTKVDEIDLPPGAGEDMAVTPDGKFAITRTLSASLGNSDFYVVRIYNDGTLVFLPEKTYRTPGQVSHIAFVPPRKTAADKIWKMYE